MIKKFFLIIWELSKIVAISLAIVIPVRYFLIQPFYVRGASMEPNFQNQDYLVVDEISYRLRAPKRGEVVVFRYPEDPREFFIKRIIGLPSETVEIRDGDIYIYNTENPNGMKLNEAYIGQSIKTYGFSDGEKVVLGPNEYYVLGDNRYSSKDSRVFGPVDKSFIIGRAIFRGWPVDAAGFIPTGSIN